MAPSMARSGGDESGIHRMSNVRSLPAAPGPFQNTGRKQILNVDVNNTWFMSL